MTVGLLALLGSRRDLETVPRRWRTPVAIGIAAIGLLAPFHSLHPQIGELWAAASALPVASSPDPQSLTKVIETPSGAIATAPPPTPDIARPATSHAPAVHESPAPRRVQPRVSVLESGSQKPAADLIAIINEVTDASSGNVIGSLRTDVGEPDPELQGIITTNLILDVEMHDTNGRIVHAFQLLARGGGFTTTAATHQARERLCEQLRERLLQLREGSR